MKVLKVPKEDSINCFFVSDLHGSIERYEKLFHAIIIRERPLRKTKNIFAHPTDPTGNWRQPKKYIRTGILN